MRLARQGFTFYGWDVDVQGRKRKRPLGPLAMVVVAAVLMGVVVYSQQAISVQLDGHSYRVAKGSTLGTFLTIAHTHARPGSLLDVDGIVIRAAATRGEVLVDGRAKPLTTTLHAGDRVRVVDGKDAKEKLTKIVRHVGGGTGLADPEFRLEQSPGVETITVGEYSRKVAGVSFSRTGPQVAANSVALTFDDGPSPLTAAILDILKDKKVKATFFLVGVQVKKYPALVKRERKMGMEIGNHSWSHPIRPPFARLSPTQQSSELDRAEDAIVAAGGKAPKLFRPPGGSFSVDSTRLVRKHKLRSVMWSVDPKDWRHGHSAGSIASEVLSHVGGGSIVLMHDGGGNVPNTIAALSRIIDGIRARGLHLVLI